MHPVDIDAIVNATKDPLRESIPVASETTER